MQSKTLLKRNESFVQANELVSKQRDGVRPTCNRYLRRRSQVPPESSISWDCPDFADTWLGTFIVS